MLSKCAMAAGSRPPGTEVGDVGWTHPRLIPGHFPHVELGAFVVMPKYTASSFWRTGRFGATMGSSMLYFAKTLAEHSSSYHRGIMNEIDYVY